MNDFFDSFENVRFVTPLSKAKAVLLLMALATALLLIGAVVAVCVLVGIVALPFIVAVALLVIAVRRTWG